jgi:1,4-dihydroxy-2-naphthoyl-CoA synthase
MIKTAIADAVATVTLDRPAVHNAFNDELIAKITETFETLGSDPSIRVIVLRASGASFSAGGDLNWMKRAAAYTAEENFRDARAGANMFLTIVRCPKPVLGARARESIGRRVRPGRVLRHGRRTGIRRVRIARSEDRPASRHHRTFCDFTYRGRKRA